MRRYPAELKASCAALGALLSACATEPPPVDPGVVPYARVQQIFDSRCAGGACHVDTLDPRSRGANLDLSAGQAAPCLINIASQLDPQQRILVKPGDPAASYLLCKVDRSCRSIVGTWMPIADPLSAEDLAVLRAWIQQGAQGGATGTCGSTPGGTDKTAPIFAGATAAASAPNSVSVNWSAATDNVTPQSQLVYLLYQAAAAGGENFLAPTYTTAPGATSFSAGKLAINTKYYFVVRARDQAGNIDANTAEVSATTPATSDSQAPSFVGLGSATASGTSITLSWSAASDNVTAGSQIVYLIYRATAAGAQNFAAPTYTTTPGATTYTATGLNAGTTYYFVVRAQDGAGNIDGNTIEKSAKTASISFSGQIQPIFSNNCMGPACHSKTSPALGLDLSSASASYSGLVGVASSQCPATKRVESTQPDMSYLIWKLDGAGPCYTGSRMPRGTPLAAADITLIRNWISAGAPNN